MSIDTTTYKKRLVRIGKKEIQLSEERYGSVAKYAKYVATPDTIVKIDDLVSSSVSGYEDHAPLLYFDFFIERDVNPNVTAELYTAGACEISDVTLVLPNNTYATVLADYLLTGQNIGEISIKKLSSTGELNQVLQNTKLQNCVIRMFHPNDDLLALSVRPQIYIDQITGFEQDTNNMGQAVTGFNFNTASREVGDGERGSGEATPEEGNR